LVQLQELQMLMIILKIIENALKNLRAEFLNRIDDVIVFNTLEKHDIDLIIEIELKKLYARLTDLDTS
jgi:ATP-dependent Clp protease ATP-binding subunit ClpC